MFALFEADRSTYVYRPEPQVASGPTSIPLPRREGEPSLPGANHVQPLRGCILTRLFMFNLFEVVCLGRPYKKHVEKFGRVGKNV